MVGSGGLGVISRRPQPRGGGRSDLDGWAAAVPVTPVTASAAVREARGGSRHGQMGAGRGARRQQDVGTAPGHPSDRLVSSSHFGSAFSKWLVTRLQGRYRGSTGTADQSANSGQRIRPLERTGFLHRPLPLIVGFSRLHDTAAVR